MNRQPPPFSDEDDLPEPEQAPQSESNSRPAVSRAEKLAWCASSFLLAGVASALLFSSLSMGMRAIVSVMCLLIGAALVVAAYRELS